MTEENPPSRVLRQRFEQEYALPYAQAIFELEPRCQSVLVTVGQYWCDEATDAVHSELIACAEREPTWPLAGQARPGALGDPAALAAMLELETKYADGDEPPGLGEVQYGLLEDASKRAFGEQYYCFLDNNSEMIVAFASYCREVSDQEQPSWRSHTPYGLVRRPLHDEPPSFEVIGQMYRPHWEDRWDVLNEDGIISGWKDGPTAPAPSGEPAAIREGATRAREPVLGPPPVKPLEARHASGLNPAYRVLLFALLILAIIAVRACRK